jgi:hypothetical protein
MAGDILGFGRLLRGNAEGAILFQGASTNAMDVYSALNSSPWTAENFGADPEKARSCKEYVAHSVLISTFYAVIASLIAGNWWALIGAAIANVYMWWLYHRALRRAQATGSKGWATA